MHDAMQKKHVETLSSETMHPWWMQFEHLGKSGQYHIVENIWHGIFLSNAMENLYAISNTFNMYAAHKKSTICKKYFLLGKKILVSAKLIY